MSLFALTLWAGVAAVPVPEVDWVAISTEAIETLQAYIRLDTSNPPGNVAATAHLLARRIEAEGIDVTRFEPEPGKVNLVARLEASQPLGQKKPILLLHHMDVVPADAARWRLDPFQAVIRDGLLWGRGAVDMKGLGTLHLYAFLALKRAGVPLSRDVIFMAVADEEVGGALGARWMIEHHGTQIDPDYVLDEGGFGSRDLFVEDRLVFGISVAEKKIVWLKLRAEGIAGHGSQPHDENPNDRLIRALSRLLSHPLPTSPVPLLALLRDRLGPLEENKFTRAIQHSTISLTTLRSGVGDPVKVNVIPSVAEATLDCRLLPGTDTASWLDEVRRRLGDPEVEIEILYESDPSIVSSHQTELYRSLASALERHYPGAEVVPILIPYGTDSNAFRHRGASSYGLTPLVLTAEMVASMHGDAERLPLTDIGKGIRVLFEALRDSAAAGPTNDTPR